MVKKGAKTEGMRNLPVIWYFNYSFRHVQPELKQLGIEFCIQAEKSGVYINQVETRPGGLNQTNFFFVGGQPRWGFEVEIHLPLRGKEETYDCRFYHGSCGPPKVYLPSLIGEGIPRPKVMKSLKDWQDNPDPGFTLGEVAAGTRLFLARGKYLLWPVEAYPLAKEDTEKALSWYRFISRHHPIFSTDDFGGDIEIKRRRVGFGMAKHSELVIRLSSLRKYKHLYLTFLEGRVHLKGRQVVYPSLEQLLSGTNQIPTTVIEEFPELLLGKSGRSLSRPQDLERYIRYLNWLEK